MNKKGIYRILAVSLAAATILSSLGGLPVIASAGEAESVQESVLEETEETPAEEETIMIVPETQEKNHEKE